MKTMSKIGCVAIIALMFAACRNYLSTGTYSYIGSPNWEIYYYLQLNDDNTYVLHYVLGGSGLSSSGKWHSERQNIILDANVPDITEFPLQKKNEQKHDETDELSIVIENMNWVYHNWYCVLDNDTLLISSDTLHWEKPNTPCELYFFVTPLSPPQLHRLPTPKESFIFSFLRQKYAQSGKIMLDSCGVYTISCDGLFGKDPMHYINFRRKVFKRENSKCLRDSSAGFLLLLDSTSQSGYEYLEKLWSGEE